MFKTLLVGLLFLGSSNIYAKCTEDAVANFLNVDEKVKAQVCKSRKPLGSVISCASNSYNKKLTIATQGKRPGHPSYPNSHDMKDMKADALLGCL